MTINASQTKDATGRGWAIVIYGLLLGSIMTVVTAPLAAILAHWRRPGSAPWVASHLRFQARTFWIGLMACALAFAAWQGLGYLGAPPLSAWIFGYLFFTALLIWLVGRCAIGIHRLTANLPIDNPKSLLLGLHSSKK